MRVTGFEPVGREFDERVARRTAERRPEGEKNSAKLNFESKERSSADSQGCAEGVREKQGTA